MPHVVVTAFCMLVSAVGLEASTNPEKTWILELGASTRVTARAYQPQSTLSIGSDGQWQSAGLLQASDTSITPTALISASFEIEAFAGLSLRIDADSGVLQTGSSMSPSWDIPITSDGQDPSNTLFAGSTIRDFALSYSTRFVSLDVGRRYGDLADGLLYRDYGTGATLSLHSDRFAAHAWRLDVAAQTLGNTVADLQNRAPFVWLEMSYLPSFFEKVSLFAAHFRDGGNRLAEVIASAAAESFIGRSGEQAVLDALFSSNSSGHINYVGSSGMVVAARGLALRWSAALARGNTTLTQGDISRSFALQSHAATLSGSYGLEGDTGLGAFALWFSGGQSPQNTGTYGAFIAPAPFWTFTGLFFNGGVNQGIYPGRSVAAGVNGHGVWGGGLSAETRLWHVDLQGRLAALMATVPSSLSPQQGRFYGYEGDLITRFGLSDAVALVVEVDALLPGSFFSSTRLAYRALAQLDFLVGL